MNHSFDSKQVLFTSTYRIVVIDSFWGDITTHVKTIYIYIYAPLHCSEVASMIQVWSFLSTLSLLLLLGKQERTNNCPAQQQHCWLLLMVKKKRRAVGEGWKERSKGFIIIY